ncbi:hypothetical protein C1645_835302 [Glomus cerebriforme]|uniref:DNA-directed DNA polymerase n=1 Tax=Glomus cerebriforme TaxID=658196 RepID=A0A397SCP2_9GLOM|nr:hypothetical protein C1645_835302 [Glomus cerebriforme]
MYTTSIFDQTDRISPLARYDDTSSLPAIPSRNDIVAEFDNEMTTILQQSLSGKQLIHFMPTEISDDTKYINGISTYILHITGSLINGQKAVMNIIEQTETGKYPGAYVFSSIKVLENKCPVTSLDFASLYPNFIITYNLSPDKIILSEEQALSVKCSGKKLHKIEFLFNVSSLGLGESLSLSEAIEQVLTNVYMNIFYGTAGDSKSPFFLCKLAEDVMSARQKNIKLVADFVKNKEFRIKYGDTDSLYLVCPEESFQKYDEAYNNDRILKEEY